VNLFPAGSITTEAALRDLGSGKATVRAAAATALGDAAPELRDEARAALIMALDDLDVDVRASAAMSLGSLGDATAAAALVLCLDDGVPTVRQCAAIALGKLAAADAFDALAGYLHKGPPDLRFQATTSLVEIDPVRAGPELRRALSDEDGEVVGAAALGLGFLADHGAVDLIAAHLDHPARRTRFDVAYALAELGDGRGSEILGAMAGDAELGWDAICALEACGAAAGDALANSLVRPVTPEHGLRAAAALLTVAPEHRATERARALFQQTLRSFRFRRRALAIELLGEIGDEWARTTLHALEIKGGRMVKEVAQALLLLRERTPDAPTTNTPPEPED